MSGITHLVNIMKLPKFVHVKQYFPHNELSEDEIKNIIAEGLIKKVIPHNIPKKRIHIKWCLFFFPRKE